MDVESPLLFVQLPNTQRGLVPILLARKNAAHAAAVQAEKLRRLHLIVFARGERVIYQLQFVRVHSFGKRVRGLGRALK